LETVAFVLLATPTPICAKAADAAKVAMATSKDDLISFISLNVFKRLLDRSQKCARV
jgi:hypothetical protein